MPDLEEKTYEDIKNDESLQLDVNLKQLIKEIDEIKDITTKDDDKIEWVFAETPEWQVIETSLNKWLLDSLGKQDSSTLNIIYGEIKKISENQNLNLSEDVKQSVKNLLQVFTQFININILINELGMLVFDDDKNKIKDIKYIKDGILSNECINTIKKIQNLWVDVSASNFEPILNNPDIILNNPDMLVVNSDYFDKLHRLYQYTKEEIQSHYHYKRWRIIENIQSHVQNLISENRDIWEAEILEDIRSDLITLPIKERVKILLWINEVVKKFNTVRKYIDFENWPYKTPKELLCAMRWITDQSMIDKITDDITVRQHWVWLTFFVWDETSYQIIYDNSLTDSESRSWWFNTEVSKIKDLVWTLSVVNWNDPWEAEFSYTYSTVLHEWQHNRNSYFMPDKAYTPINRAKDEILANLREGEDTEDIEYTLTESWWLYQYGLEWDARENHKEQVKELLGYVKYLIKLTENHNTWLTRDKVISMLSDTPVNKWQKLRLNIEEAVKTHGNELIFSKFWRAGTAEKQTEIDEIMLANSIEEIKRVLNNPKYSHISRVPNNKWWIEISAIIDDVVSWKLDITFVPAEIRSQVQKFINQ